MPIAIGSQTLTNGGTARFNNTDLSSIKFRSTEVWKKQKALSDLSASQNYTLSSTSGTMTKEAGTWDLSGFNTLTYTASNGSMGCYYWTSPYGTVYSNSYSIVLVFADNTTMSMSFGSGKTLNLSSKTDAQKASVKVRVTCSYSCSTLTNVAGHVSFSVTNAVAS